jgi:uncharacterized protein (TIGR02001 family)
MKRLLIATAAMALAVTTVPAFAADDDELIPEKMVPGSFSANVGVVSEYLFRGISQSDDQPALQGGFDWSLDSKPVGVYVGTWLSNIDFAASSGSSLEWDMYAGVQGEISSISWKLGGIYYYYPSEPAGSNFSYAELAMSLGYDFGMFSTSLGFNYSPDYFGGSGDAEFVSFAVSVPLGKYFTLGANVGRQWIDDNAQFGTPDYWVYGASIAAKIFGFDTTLAVTDTDIGSTECFGTNDLCGATVTLMVARSF